MPVFPAPSPRARSPVTAQPYAPGENSAFLPDPDYDWVLSELANDSRPTKGLSVGDDRDSLSNTMAPPAPSRSVGDTPMPARIVPLTIHQTIVPFRGPNHSTKTAPGTPAESDDEFARIPAEQFPEPGETFEGFVLKERLGRGAFAHVYLAEQVGLSNRDVALKLTKKLGKEAGRLARLQHANVVPIFSFHAGEEWQAICMPFFGRQTLDDILRQIRANGELPKSGCEVFSTVAARAESTQRSGTNLRPVLVPAEPVRPTEAGSRGELRDVLTNLSYTDAAVLLVAQIADGLAHAHSLGVWHLDLKPANVLVSDHGQPMLLDFNLAFDTWHERRERFGGTVPYMAPEQLDEMIESRERTKRNEPIDEHRVSRVNARTDLYATGILLYELLTGRHPFPTAKTAPDGLAAARAARTAPRETARELNPNVSPGLNAVVERLLAPYPTDRYVSAAALRRDLLNHLENKPLESVRVPSLAERFAKWKARHPKALARCVAASAIVAAVGTAGWGATQWRANVAAAARDRATVLRKGLAIIRMDLAATGNPAHRTRGLQKATEAFAAVGVTDAATLAASPALNRLEPADRAAALDDLGEVAALARLVASDPASQNRWAALAADCFRGRATPVLLGGDDRGPRAQFLAGTAALKDGRPADAVAAFERVVAVEPEHGAAQFLLAFALDKQDRHARAAERYEMAAALVPDDARASFNLGQIYQGERRYDTAEKAYTAAILRDPTDAEAYLHRGQCRANLGLQERALADCDTALSLGGASLRVYALRANIHRLMGNESEEKKDLATVAATAPVTPADYLARGVTRSLAKPKPDYDGALADFRAAADANPNFYAAWNNQAYVYDKRNEIALAIEAMNRAIEVNEQSGELRLGRAVLLARLGKRTAALDDVATGLALTDRPWQTYQAACTYAVMSKANPADADKAVELLRKAIRDGFRDPDHMAKDSDLDPIRKREDVIKLFAVVKEMATVR